VLGGRDVAVSLRRGRNANSVYYAVDVVDSVRRQRRWLEPGNPTVVMVLACTAWFMVILDVSIVNVALPSIRAALGFSPTQLQWVVNAYTLTFAGLLLLGGRMGDLLGRRFMLLMGLLLFTGASLLGAVASSRGLLIGARAVQGIGGAIIAPTSLSILSTTFAEGVARNRALGIWGAIGGVGGSAGAILGGVLTEGLNWRWILLVNVPIGLATMVLSARLIPESTAAEKRGRRHYDIAGAVSVTAGLTAIVFAIVRTDVNGWGSAQTLLVLGAGLALIAAFVLIEARISRDPLVPLRIFASRTLTGANVTMLFIAGALFSMWFFLTLYMQEVLGFSPIEAGLGFLPLTGCIVLGSALASRLVARVGVRPLLITGAGLASAGMLLFARMPADGSFLTDVLPPSLLAATGMGLSFVPTTIAAVSGVARGEAGLASGLLNTARQMGGSLGLAILATIAASRTATLLHGHHSTRDALTEGYHRAFVVAAGFALCSALAAFLLVRTAPQPAPPETRAALEPAP
jgi:EmrB/QacA subfamily drug resistance transporter